MPRRPQIKGRKGEERHQISRWEHLAKLAISDYLQTCLNGSRRQFFTRFAPYMQNWVVDTDKVWTGEHPMDQAIQIARFFEGTSAAPPQILLRTNGYTFAPQNLGNFAVGQRQRDADGNVTDQQLVGVVETTRVPVDMAVAALDEDQAHYLIHFIETALGSMNRFHVNGVLMPEAEERRNWCVQLPLSWSVGGLTEVPIGDDQKRRLWTTTFSEEVDVEVATWAQYSTPFTATAREGGPSHLDEVAITVPGNVKVGSSTPLYVNARPADSQWRVDDFTLARITVSEALYAKRVGRVNVSLISAINRGDEYATAEVQIIP
jgi:hypothetical protein